MLYHQQFARLTSDGALSNLISAYHFEKDGVLQSIVHGLKYSGMTRLGIELGRRLGECVKKEIQDLPGIAAIIPVPLHRTKQRERGYNQSLFIAKGISEVTRISCNRSLLTRQKYTRSQTELTISERKRNVGDAFSVNRSYTSQISCRTFILVDDVITTGATIVSCAQTLLDAGAKSVIACSVALAELQ